MSVVDMKTQESEQVAAKGGKKKLIIIVVVLLLVAGVGAYLTVLKPKGKATPPEPGAVVKMDAIQINLADDHYLKIGIALQASKKAGEEVDGSKALDKTIELFSGRDMAELGRKKEREHLKKELVNELEDAYEDDVIGVYFTDFVMQ